MRILSLAALLMTLAQILPVNADELRPALTATAEFNAIAARPLDQPEPGVPFEITVTITNALGTDPPAGLQLAGWLRPVEDGNQSCTEAARSFLATGRLPTGAVKLNGALIGVAAEDGSFTIADPEINLASANLLGATRLQEPPASLVADTVGRRFLAALPGRGEVLAIAVPDATVTVLAADLSGPVMALPAPDGAAWVLEKARMALTRIEPDGAQQPIAEGVERLTASPSGAEFATAGPSGAALWDAATGTAQITLPDPAVDSTVLADARGTFALATLAGREISIRYVDAPDTAFVVTMPVPATRLAAGPGGRWLLAHDPQGDGPVMLVDVGRGKVIQTIATPGRVSEIAFTDRAAYLMTADQSRIGVLDLAAIKADRPAPLREVMLGQARASALDHAGYLAPLWPQPGMIAVHAESYTGFIVHDYSMMGDAPPMSAIRLRGGVPRLVAGFDRSFRETAAGVFRTTAMLPGPGRYELVTTTGIGALSFCAALPPTAGDIDEAPRPGRLHALRDADDPGHVRLTFRGGDGALVGNATFRVLVTGLATPWRDTVTLHSDASGAATEPLALPTGGPVAIAAMSSDGSAFHPLVLEVP